MFLKFSGVSVVLIMCGFCLTTTAQEKSAERIEPTNSNYKIGVGDSLKIVVARNDLLSLDGVRVGNRGTIRMPMIDSDVQAACLTEVELAASLTEKYKKYLLNPQIFVMVKDFQANPVALVGAVTLPGRFQMQRPMRLLELLTYVNGPTLNAGRTIQIIRTVSAVRCEQNVLIKNDEPRDSKTGADDDQELIVLPLAETMKGNPSANPFVQSGDIIRVTEAEQAYIIGSVKNAAAISLKEPVTLSKAIAMAGGAAPGARIENIKITRQEPNSLVKTELSVNLKEINKQGGEDVLLQANDVVDVPGPSGTKKFLKDIVRTIIPIVTRVPVIIP